MSLCSLNKKSQVVSFYFVSSRKKGEGGGLNVSREG